MSKPDIILELPGWSLLWIDLELLPSGRGILSALRSSIADEVRVEHRIETLARHPPIAAMRRLFKAAGCDPTRYRPSAEALLRRILKGSSLPGILPFVDLGNCLSARLAVPVCVMAENTFSPPFTFRSGQRGESYESLRGPFKLEGKPLLVDGNGPCDTPITGSRRVKVEADTERATLVAYLPSDTVSCSEAEACLTILLETAPVARFR